MLTKLELAMATRCVLGPIGMIFTPCRDGRGHCREEWADERACASGATALLVATLCFDEGRAVYDHRESGGGLVPPEY
jgi:hypothetical protein